jgi:hypothetical protein
MILEECTGIAYRFQDSTVIDQITHDLHSPSRQLIELKMQHAELNALIDTQLGSDELHLRRLKKDKLALKDRIFKLEMQLTPPELA